MSNSGNSCNFYNGLRQTDINDAYKFHTHSQFLNSSRAGSLTNYSPICIFCSSSNTHSLMQDGGSFRQCGNCRKQFKADFASKPCYK